VRGRLVSLFFRAGNRPRRKPRSTTKLIATSDEEGVAPAAVSGASADNRALKPKNRSLQRLIADGLTSGPIAARPGLSVATVKSHVAAIHAKLGARSRAHAVAIGFRQGLLR